MTPYCVFDVETGSLPEGDLLSLFKPRFEPDRRLVDPRKIEDDLLKKQAAWLEEAALHAERGRILLLGYRTQGRTTILEGDETDILLNFVDMAKRSQVCTFVGHNILGFDLPFIRRRCLVHGIPVPFYDRSSKWNPWLITTFDTMLDWMSGDRREMISLTNLARALGIPAEDDGVSEQFGHIYETDKPRALAHLERDLLLNEEIYRRLV